MPETPSGRPLHVCVVLSGSGYLDGSEIHEAVLTLLAIRRAGATWQCAAPDKPQMHVVDHRMGAPVPGESRNALTEAARIARGNVIPLAEVDASRFDAVFLPGGYGAAKNLSTLAVAGPDGSVDPDLERVLTDFHLSGKPIGAVCIAPAVVVMALGKGTVTIGNDAGTAAAIRAMGGTHVERPVTEVAIDRAHRIATAPAYMCEADIAQVATGIEAAVRAVLEMCR